MMGDVPTETENIFKATEKWLHGNKNLGEILISTTYLIKYDVKVGKLVFVQ